MRKLRPRKQQGKWVTGRLWSVSPDCKSRGPLTLLCCSFQVIWDYCRLSPFPHKTGVPSQNWLFRGFGQMNVSSSKMSSLGEPVLFTDVFSTPRTVLILWKALNKCLWMKEWNEIGIFIFYKITWFQVHRLPLSLG